MITRRLVALVTLLSGCALPYDFGPPASGSVEETSLVAILARPQDFNGRRVWVAGVVNFEFEGNALFLTEEHHRHWLPRYAAWLRANLEVLRAQPEQLSRLNGRYVLIEGEVNASCHGHLSSFPVCIEDVTQIRTVD